MGKTGSTENKFTLKNKAQEMPKHNHSNLLCKETNSFHFPVSWVMFSAKQKQVP